MVSVLTARIRTFGNPRSPAPPRWQDAMNSTPDRTPGDKATVDVDELIRGIHAARDASDLEKLAVRFREARARTLHAFRPRLRRAQAQAYAHAGLVALGKGDRGLARLHFYNSLRNRPFKFKTYGRFVKTFMPLGLVRILSGRRVRDARISDSRRA